MVEIEKNVLVMLAKKPELGKVKTRIAKETSEDFALKFALSSIKDVITNIKDSRCYDFVVATDTPQELEWFEKAHNLPGILIEPSEDKNLSYKMNFVFNTLLKNYEYEKTTLIPMDVPFITSTEIIFALSKLNNNNYVLGPEPNGGVYLIGIRKDSLNNKLFNNVAWSTPHSFDSLMGNLGKEHTYVLNQKDDLNTFQDILNNKENIKLFCPNVDRLLQTEPY
jgi:uncharacterized protein